MLIENEETMEKSKQKLLQEQANKIDEVLTVLRADYGDAYADEINYLEIVKNNLKQSCH